MDICIPEILNMTCDKSALAAIDACIHDSLASGSPTFGVLISTEIADRFSAEGDGWEKVRGYCRHRFNDDMLAPYHFVKCLLRVCRPTNLGVWVATNALEELEPDLLFDNDGLLVGPVERLTFTKEGILTPTHYLLYDPALPGAWKSGGFVDDLLRFVKTACLTNVGVAVARDVVLLRNYYAEYFTKAYIRGPRGLDASILQDPNFPEDPAGTVTEHHRVSHDPLATLFPVCRLEVMWSYRDGIKTVQIEELVSVDNNRATNAREIRNRYLHARWDPPSGCFIHTDGAIKYYARGKYHERLATDLKKFPGRADLYQKVFRIDGSVSISDWCRLVAKFFEENELMVEYLGGPESLNEK
jgi:hypothetical protein